MRIHNYNKLIRISRDVEPLSAACKFLTRLGLDFARQINSVVYTVKCLTL